MPGGEADPASEARVSADVLRFVVEGEPVPKGRARTRVVTPKGGKAFASHYTPPETKAYEERVALLCRVAVAGARWAWTDKDRFTLLVQVFRTHEGKGGDLDNYVKAISDAINGVAFGDDRYIRGIGASLQPPDPKRPRVVVEVRRVAPSRRS
jgi:crossover junction endodeoxyribonuclease RusA